MQERIVDVSERFEELAGTTLVWCGATASHSTLIFRASGSTRGYGKVHFAYVSDIDFASPMCNVKLRMATTEENQLLLSRLTERQQLYTSYPYDEMGWSPRDGRIAIECEEGTFFIWARFFSLTWSSEPNLGMEREVGFKDMPLWDFKRPLWKGGPSLREL